MKTTYLNFANVYDENSRFRPRYSVSMLQSARDVITIILKAECGAERAYWIPIKKCPGTRWKVNKRSISNDSGEASDLIQFFIKPENVAYLMSTINALIFSGNIEPIY